MRSKPVFSCLLVHKHGRLEWAPCGVGEACSFSEITAGGGEVGRYICCYLFVSVNCYLNSCLFTRSKSRRYKRTHRGLSPAMLPSPGHRCQQSLGNLPEMVCTVRADRGVSVSHESGKDGGVPEVAAQQSRDRRGGGPCLIAGSFPVGRQSHGALRPCQQCL